MHGVPTPAFSTALAFFDGYRSARLPANLLQVSMNIAWIPGPFILTLTHLSLASLLWDIGKQKSPRCDAAERGVPSGAILFAQSNFIEKWNKFEKPT